MFLLRGANECGPLDEHLVDGMRPRAMRIVVGDSILLHKQPRYPELFAEAQQMLRLADGLDLLLPQTGHQDAHLVTAGLRPRPP